MPFTLFNSVVTFVIASCNIECVKTCENEQTEVLHASVVRLRSDAQKCALANSPNKYPLR